MVLVPEHAFGFFVHHAKDVVFRDVRVEFAEEDLRPPFVLHDAADVHFEHVQAARAAGAPFCVARDVKGLSVHDSPGVPDLRREHVDADAIR